MGAQLTEQMAEGRTADEAYKTALAEATSYYGTQDGYSGAINSKDHGFVTVDLPPRVTYRKLQAWLEELDEVNGAVEWANDEISTYNWRVKNGHLKATKREAARLTRAREKAMASRDRFLTRIPPDLDIERLSMTYSDKWAQPLCVQLRPSEAKPSKRGRRVYVFFGYAPS